MFGLLVGMMTELATGVVRAPPRAAVPRMTPPPRVWTRCSPGQMTDARAGALTPTGLPQPAQVDCLCVGHRRRLRLRTHG
jgi:hypothetical protein